jgi:hypothetical protein
LLAGKWPQAGSDFGRGPSSRRLLGGYRQAQRVADRLSGQRTPGAAGGLGGADERGHAHGSYGQGCAWRVERDIAQLGPE